MASTAKNTHKNTRTYASAVAGVTEKSIFSTLAKCQLKKPRNVPNARIPNTTEQHSFFIDLKSTDASEEEVLAAITLDGIVGAIPRDDLWVVELICKNDAVVEAAMNTVFRIEGKKQVEAIMPRHKTNKLLLIKIANVPFGDRQDLTEKLSTYWTQYGTVIDTAPYMFPGKPWLTKRWDVLLQLNEGIQKLDAPPVFTIDGYTDTLVCSWSGAKKACLRCKCAGHSTSKCPANKPKNQKVGELANPLQKIGGLDKAQKRQKKESEVSPGNAEKTEASSSASASATKSATPASPATVATPIPAPSGNFTVTGSLPRFEPTPMATASSPTTFLGSELQQPRTPPPQHRPDPETPRKGPKHGAKDNAWTPTHNDLMTYIEHHNVCTKCCKKGHRQKKCPDKTLRNISMQVIANSEKFRPHMEAMSSLRRKRGLTWRFYDKTVAGPYDPPICTRCNGEHIDTDCKEILECNHCGQDHLGINCPNRPTYAFEAMDTQT